LGFWTYILRCADGSYYVGHTDDLETRFAQHQSGQLAGYTQTRLPAELVWSEEFSERHQAFETERRLKGWSRAKKEALISGDWDRVRELARRVLRDAASTSSAAPQDERDPGHGSASLTSAAPAGERRRQASPQSNPAPPEEGLSAALRAEPKARLEGPMITPPPVIVLVRPQLGENIGKAARAMLNFGLTEMRLVTPRDGWPNPSAGPAAAGADVVLEGAQVFGSLAEAVADCANVYATTVRKRGVTKPVVTPEQAAREVHAAPGRSAYVFGPERSGLETEDVALARAILTVPINPQFGSLNLAQAVILCAYEWSKQTDLSQPTVEELLPPAPQEELEGLIGHFERMLEAKNYFWPDTRAETNRLTLRNLLTKPAWNHLEVRTFRGILSTLEKERRAR